MPKEKRRFEHREKPEARSIGNIETAEENRTVYGTWPMPEAYTGADSEICGQSLAERLEAVGGAFGDPVFIRIFKWEAQLEVWMKTGERYALLRTYRICRLSGLLGPKLKEGDRQSPEGFYYVNKSRLNPNSRFHLAFNIGYPNSYDRAHGRTGSALMVHGNCVSVGCFAMTDEKIEEIYELVERALEKGQKIVRVHIFPFRMSREQMEEYRYHPWYSFWENLKEGYDYFERWHLPPDVRVEKGLYVFGPDVEQ